MSEPKSINILIFVVKSVLIFSGLLLLIACFYTYTKPYQDVTATLIDLYGKQDRLDEFRKDYLTPERFTIIRYVLVAALTGIALILIRVKQLTVSLSELFHSVKAFGKYLAEIFSLLSKTQKLIFLLLLLVIAGIKFHFLPRFFFHIDEITSYLFFIKRGFLVSVSYYPNPNNHILYSLICYFMQPFIKDPFYLMKIPSWIISIFASGFMFLFLRRHFGFATAITGMVIFSFAGFIFIYSLFGRGYVLMTFFTMISSAMMLEIVSGKQEKFYRHIYILASILGFYTMLIYVYPMASLACMLMICSIRQKKYGALKLLIYDHCLIIVFVLLLYLPVILISGPSALTSNSWIVRLSFDEFVRHIPQFTKEAFIHILDSGFYPVFTGITIIGLAVVLLIRQKRSAWVWLLTCAFLVPLILLILQRVQPYERIWTYLIFFISLCFVILADAVFSLLKTKVLITSVFIILNMMIVFFSIVYFQRLVNGGHGVYADVNRISRYTSETGRVYTNENTYNLYLRYHYTMMGKQEVPDMEVRSPAESYAYVILSQGSVFPAGIRMNQYSLREQNEFVKVYARKTQFDN